MISERHIFLAEDDEYIRLSLSVTLSKRGYKVTLAENGQEALEKIIALKAAGTPPDLLLTDIRMPGMSGIELIDRLKKLDVSLPVFVITGYGDKDMVVELMRRGCSDFIDKPFSPPDLLGRLLPIFEKKEKERAEKQKQQVQQAYEKAELTREIESYIHNFKTLRKQVDSAVETCHDLFDIREDGHNVLIARHHQPLSELGGDFFDIRNTPTGCDILVADVAGHDMGASYHTVLIKAFFDENCRTGNHGDSFFRLLNKQLLENGKNERMVTALFLRLNLETMHGEVLSAGHPPLIKLLKKLPGISRIATCGDVLGIHDSVSFDSQRFSFAPGDRFFLHTDGLTNAYRLNTHTGKKEKLGRNGLDHLIKKQDQPSLKNMVRNIAKGISEFHGYKFNDDMLLVGVEIPAVS